MTVVLVTLLPTFTVYDVVLEEKDGDKAPAETVRLLKVASELGADSCDAIVISFGAYPPDGIIQLELVVDIILQYSKFIQAVERETLERRISSVNPFEYTGLNGSFSRPISNSLRFVADARAGTGVAPPAVNVCDAPLRMALILALPAKEPL